MGLQVTPFFTLAANPSLGFSPNSCPLTRYFRHAARREKVQEAGLGGDSGGSICSASSWWP